MRGSRKERRGEEVSCAGEFGLKIQTHKGPEPQTAEGSITCQDTESKPGALLRRVELVVLGCIWLYD